MSYKLRKWTMVTVVLSVLIVGLSGRFSDPWLWAFVVMWSGLILSAVLSIDEDLARERFDPPEPGADKRALAAVRLTGFGSLLLGAVDAGHWQLAPIPTGLRLIGFAGTMVFATLVFRAMRANRYFSPVVRIQTERGHRVVDAGPYAYVRHPGYAGMILAAPSSALALGSGLGLLVALAYSALIVRRVWFEDGFLRSGLDGYSSYAARVPYRLIPGVW